jgi:hypothetical protein
MAMFRTLVEIVDLVKLALLNQGRIEAVLFNVNFKE